MNGHHEDIRRLLSRVRSRWRRLIGFRALVRASLAVALVASAALLASAWAPRAPVALAVIGACGALVALAALVWGLWPIRQSTSDARVARYIEEQEPALEDRLVSAVHLAGDADAGPALSPAMLADAARRSAAVDPGRIVPGDRLRRAGLAAAAAVALLAAVLFFARHTVRQSFDAAALALFPSRVTLEVLPGNARVPAGTPLTIEARLIGNRAPVIAQLVRADPDEEVWQPIEMTSDAAGTFRHAIESIGESFRYRVSAGTLTSPVYEVNALRPPRVVRIDLEYAYPPALGLEPRVEEDSGDIYAPAGTEVRVRIHTDRAAADGHLAFAEGNRIALRAESPTLLVGAVKVVEDGSYRVGLSDADGLSNGGDTEYFVRTIEDRLPEVRVLRPARDRSVTSLEEVEIQAEAEDDYGVDRLELVYAVRGGKEQAVPLDIPRSRTAVSGQRTIYVEDLDVAPGDFISYYVRARDQARGRRAGEARSDIFFLEVKPFEQEFSLAQSQGSGAGQNRSVDDLVAAQKEIIVATWKLDRRTSAAGGARPEADIKAVARAESELKTRVEQISSSFRTFTMRDPRRIPRPGGPVLPPSGLRAGQTLPEEDAMTAAAAAMGEAVAALSALRTSEALPSEMAALNHLLKAQAEVKERQVTRQQAGSGAGGNRAGQDLSSLFDRELQRQQQTNYETPTAAEGRDDAADDLADRIKELARRQDELLRRQQELARQRGNMSPEELRRELERLTREQAELSRRAEDMAGRMERSERSAGQQQSGRGGRSGSGSEQGAGGQMRQASEEMRSAASELRRDDPSQATARSARALQRLEEAARQTRASAPDERRRALGDMQLEARQLADAQRDIADEARRAGRDGRESRGSGQQGADPDTMRRLAGEQQRLAERAKRLQERMNAAAPGAPSAQELERLRVPERMLEAAGQMRGAGEKPGDLSSVARAQEDVARALDRAAEGLADAREGGDRQSRALSDQRARAQQLREEMERVSRDMARLDEEARRSSGAQPGPAPGSSGKPGDGEAAGGGGIGGEAQRLRDQFQQRMRESRELLERLRRDDSAAARGGSGLTFEGQGMTLSAPGTEAFKQDFARWEELRRQVSVALEGAEAALAQQLAAAQSRDRLAAGFEDRAPAEYQQQVDSYFKAIAGRKIESR